MALKLVYRNKNETIPHLVYSEGKAYYAVTDGKPNVIYTSPSEGYTFEKITKKAGKFLKIDNNVYDWTKQPPMGAFAFGRIKVTENMEWIVPHDGVYEFDMSGSAGSRGGVSNTEFNDWNIGVDGKRGELRHYEVRLNAGDKLLIKIGLMEPWNHGADNFSWPDKNRNVSEYTKEFERIRGKQGNPTTIERTNGSSINLIAKGGSGGNFQGAFHEDKWRYDSNEANNMGSDCNGWVIISEKFENRIDDVKFKKNHAIKSRTLLTKDRVLLAIGCGNPKQDMVSQKSAAILKFNAGEFYYLDTTTTADGYVTFCGNKLGEITTPDENNLDAIEEIGEYDSILSIYDITDIYERTVKQNEQKRYS